MQFVRARRAASLRAAHVALSESDFVGLYERELGRVFNYARYRLGPAEAEDLAADVFARAWAHQAAFDPGRGTAAMWLWGIARRAVIDRLRQARDASEGIDPAGDEPQDRAEVLARIEAWSSIRQALAVLASVDQDIIGLRFGAGHTNRDIAGLLGLSEANVAQRLRRALRRMREHLQAGGEP